VSQKKKADNTVLLIGGHDKDRNLHVIDFRFGKMMPEQIIATIFELCDKWNLNAVTIEVVAFQLVLAHMLRSSFNRFRPIVVNEYKPKGEKKARIQMMLEPYFTNRKIWLTKPLLSLAVFKEEIEYFSMDVNNRVHDDFLDAIAIMIEVSVPLAGNSKVHLERYRKRHPINRKYGGVY